MGNWGREAPKKERRRGKEKGKERKGRRKEYIRM